jgi:superfamily I DNA/RNA helicase
MSIHTSKGDEADNAALVVASVADESMINDDPRLEYVALTRAKKNMYPGYELKNYLLFFRLVFAALVIGLVESVKPSEETFSNNSTLICT